MEGGGREGGGGGGNERKSGQKKRKIISPNGFHPHRPQKVHGPAELAQARGEIVGCRAESSGY